MVDKQLIDEQLERHPKLKVRVWATTPSYA